MNNILTILLGIKKWGPTTPTNKPLFFLHLGSPAFEVNKLTTPAMPTHLIRPANPPGDSYCVGAYKATAVWATVLIALIPAVSTISCR